jgi:hypothetical protein
VKYILMVNTMKTGRQNEGILAWAKQDFDAHIAFMRKVNKELKQAGEFVLAEGLAFPDQARLVRAAKDGTPITDGIFPESKQFLAGFWIVDVATAERACDRRPGLNGARTQGRTAQYEIEERQILAPPKSS